MKSNKTSIQIRFQNLQNSKKISQHRRQNDPNSKSGGGLGGSWSLSRRLCRVLGRLGCVLRRLGCFLERLGGALGGVLGACVLGSFGGGLGEFQAPLRASWGVLACLEASWGRPGLDFRSNIVAYYFGCHFLTDIQPILHPKFDPRSLTNHLNLLEQ